MTLAKAKATTNETFIVQASLTIVTYNRKNIFIVQPTVGKFNKHFFTNFSTCKIYIIEQIVPSNLYIEDASTIPLVR